MASNGVSLLIHEHELNEILDMVRKAKGNKIVGSLYGLWRTSLRQLVIHMAVGPGKKAKLSPNWATVDQDYHAECTEYFKQNHGLLQIGLWLSGPLERYSRIDPRGSNFQSNDPFLPNTSPFVLLCVVMEPRISFDLVIVDVNQPQNNRFKKICQEDVLAGESCFRMLPEISKEFKEINKKALFARSNKSPKVFFSRRDHPISDNAHISGTAHEQPREQSREQQQQPQQDWYDTDNGAQFVSQFVQRLRAIGISVEMSSDVISHNLKFTIIGKLAIDFPTNFPHEEPSFTFMNNASRGVAGYDEMLRRLVGQVTSIIRVI